MASVPNQDCDKGVKVVSLELSEPLQGLSSLQGYRAAQCLIRLHGCPIGYVRVPLRAGCVSTRDLAQAVLDRLHGPIVSHLLEDLLSPDFRMHDLDAEHVLALPHPSSSAPRPSVTVAICTRDRTEALACCLDAVNQLDDRPDHILVIDNAPRTGATEALVHQKFPGVRYVCEPRPGLDWARNRAILETHTDILAFTDDDVVVDRRWTRALADTFADNPHVMAVTGLVVPHSLDTEAEQLFERYGGFGRGFIRRFYGWSPTQGPMGRVYGGTGRFGTGANMAFRRSLFNRIGLFDPALDVGTVTNGGGDLDMFFRVLKEGYALVYEPAAIVFHRHRRDYAALRTQLMNNGIGFYAYVMRSALTYRDERWAFLRLGLWWAWYWNLRRLLRSYLSPGYFPRDLVLAELQGSLRGLGRYFQARREASRIRGRYGPQEAEAYRPGSERRQVSLRGSIAVRTVDLASGPPSFDDVTGYLRTLLYVTHGTCLVGKVTIANHQQPIGRSWLRQILAEHLGQTRPGPEWIARVRWAVTAELTNRSLHGDAGVAETMPEKLPEEVPVSIVVATYDRPQDLRRCLHGLQGQATARSTEIVVVDNHPESGLTPPAVAEFPGVTLVNEGRKGLSYARNAGIRASQGAIIVCTDDDVVVPAGWLETLLRGFMEQEVMAVTGNVLPLEQDSRAQILFEAYGGLGRGFSRLYAGREWFNGFRGAVRTWALGGTANAAFRRSIFSHPDIGLLDEALGAGTPTGCSEDTYLFYKILKAGGVIVYEPDAYVWHKHRREMAALRRQLYNYSKGHVAYHLTTLLRDGDVRALVRLGIQLPKIHLARTFASLTRRHPYPVSLILLEVLGNLAGPWGLWRARRRVRRKGRSTEPISPSPQKADLALTSQDRTTM